MEINSVSNKPNFPRGLVLGLGGLVMLLVVLMIAQKATDLSKTWGNKKPQNTMTVSADGKVPATPDMATVTVGVISDGKDAAEVKNQNNDKVKKMTDFIKQQGIEDKDINTSQFYFYPQQDYRDGKSIITGYQGNQTVTVKVRGIDKSRDVLNKVLDGVVNVGANQIQGVSFTFDDPNALQQEARRKAIENAKQKAQELAQQAGLTLGKVVSVSESSNFGYPEPMPYAQAALGYGAGGADLAKSIAPSVEPGTQDIIQTMSVTFELK